MLELAWIEARSPCGLLTLPATAKSTASSSIRPRPQITAVYFYCVLYTDAHLPPESHNMCALSFFVFFFAPHQNTRSPVVAGHVCSVSVYKYGSQTAVMAPAPNKQRAEKPHIPPSLWPKSRLDRHPTSSHWMFSSSAPLQQVRACGCEPVKKREGQQGGESFDMFHMLLAAQTQQLLGIRRSVMKRPRDGEMFLLVRRRRLSWVWPGEGAGWRNNIHVFRRRKTVEKYAAPKSFRPLS